MKNIIQFFGLSLISVSISSYSYAVGLDAKPLKDLLSTIAATQFTYTETGMAFSFENIRSCVYTSEDMIVIKNYCSPKKEYPAKGYTILSAKFGIIEFYQEDLTSVLKREVRINEFPEVIAPYLAGSLKSKKLTEINPLLEAMYDQPSPGCWSTNYSFYTKQADANCYRTDIAQFPDWANETQTTLSSESDWLQIVKTLETQFPQ